MEDDQGVMVAKKANFRSWLGKMFTDNSHDSHQLPATSKALENENQWENYAQEIENYFEHLLSLNLDEEICKEENDILQAGSTEPGVAEDAVSTMAMSVAAKMASMRRRMEGTQKMIQMKREESKVNSERCAKAEWAKCLCNSRVEELEAKIQEEVLNRLDLSKSLDAENEQIQEIRRDIQESKKRLSSLVELRSEVYSKLQTSTMARSHVEVQLEKAVIARAQMVRAIEELRRQRDVLRRRIEFCKEKDAVGTVAKLNELCCGYREYTTKDIRSATDNFSESLRLKSGGHWTNVYRGRINHTTVAIKMLSFDNRLSQEAFLAKVKALNSIRHPHLVAIIGSCSEPRCIIFEYMHNGSLRDILFSSSQRNHGKRNRAFRWNHRIRVAHEICSGLSFLHLARPRPFAQVHLTASNVLVDRNLVAKIGGFRLTQSPDANETLPNIQAFGVLLFQLLTGRNRTGLVEEAMAMDKTALLTVLDERAGKWPLDLAYELVGIATRCLECKVDFSLAKTREELEKITRKADDLVAKSGCEVVVNGSIDDREDSSEAPSIFLCPILQEVMKNPHVAADGFSYELEAIEEWLNTERDTSPMTNLRLKHKFLTPNHTLRSLIQEWNRRKSTAS